MKKKILALVLCIALVASLTIGLVACDPQSGHLQGVKIVLPNGEKAVAKIGVLHIGPKSADSGYTFAHQQGIEAMIKNCGLKEGQVVYKDSLDDQKKDVISTEIESLIGDGCNVIIGTSFGYGSEMKKLSKNYPNVYFSHGTGGESGPNMNNYFGRIYQARYLSGMVAGLKAEQGANIGYVSAHGTNIAECCSGINAFAMGVQSVNKDAQVKVKTLGKWFDPDNEAAYAKTLLDECGCQVVAQHCDTSNPSQQAKILNKYSIGYNSDMATALTEEGRESSVLTSVIWHWGVYYTELLNSLIANEFKELGNYYGDYADGLFGLAELSKDCAKDTQKYLDLVEDVMKDKDNSWDVFSGTKLSFTNTDGNIKLVETKTALLDNEGNEIVKAGGASVSDFVITVGMDYFVKGVELI